MRPTAQKRLRRANQGLPPPTACDSLHSKGQSAAAAGKHELASSLFAQAIQLEGPKPQYCHNLAKSLQASGKYRQAAACYQQAIAAAPGDVLLYLGLARTLLLEARLSEAITVLNRALLLQPGVAEGWALLGGALSLTGHPDHALEALRQAVALDPGQALFHFDLGLVLSQCGESAAAETAYRRALQLNPSFPEALNNLGNLLRRRNAPAEALGYFRRAIHYRPEYTDAAYNLGLALQDLQLLEDAETYYDTVLTKRPEHHAAFNNLANVLIGQDRLEAAISRYETAVRLAPGSREYRVNLGMAQLLAGDFSNGWRNYGWRQAPSISEVPLWSGQPIENRKILLLSEQGLGDTLQFIRYATRLSHAGAHVSASCPASLVEVLRTVPGLETVTASGQPLPACDLYSPLLHLPAIFGTQIENIPAEIPYLSADPERVRQWGLSLEIPRSHLKVGIVWRGGAEHWNDHNRSLSPDCLATLAGVTETAWVSLQKGYREGCASLPFVPLKRELTDFADTAALMANLDLVISVDTSVAHLAGALARPVWTLLPFVPDWRWLRERADSPWYPGMKLFRQEQRGKWKPTLERVREELVKLQSRKQNSVMSG